MSSKTYVVYILTNTSKMLYVGVTGNIHRRMFEHKNKCIPGYSRDYNLHQLAFAETFGNVDDAIRREKEIKGWLRKRKIDLIQTRNPHWKDLAADWFRTSKSQQPSSK